MSLSVTMGRIVWRGTQAGLALTLAADPAPTSTTTTVVPPETEVPPVTLG
jgi:hypothetical protein